MKINRRYCNYLLIIILLVSTSCKSNSIITNTIEGEWIDNINSKKYSIQNYSIEITNINSIGSYKGSYKNYDNKLEICFTEIGGLKLGFEDKYVYEYSIDNNTCKLIEVDELGNQGSTIVLNRVD